MWASICLIAAFVPLGAYALFAAVLDAVVALAMCGTLATLALLCLAEAFHRWSYFDLDRRMLARFGNPAHGAEIAACLGYTLLATDEARLVDQLTFLPNSQALIREFLQMASAPRMWEVARIAAEGAAQSQGGGLKTQRPAIMVATTSASRSSQGSRSRTTRSAA
jgi:hypothetical protein